jgi:hypothetical protein
MLKLVPTLEYLELGLTSPHTLSEKFFKQFLATEPRGRGPHQITALPWLRGLIVCYKRWLRGSERKTLIPVFGEIVESHQERQFRLQLYFPDPDGCWWYVEGPVERFGENEANHEVVIGISCPNGIVCLSSGLPLGLLPFKEAEYLYVGDGELPIDILFTLCHLVELRTYEYRCIIEPKTLPVNLPFYHVIRVLEAEAIHPSYLAGQTFHKLERCRVGVGVRYLSEGLFTEMPVCTRLDVKNISLLATFKLPLICELDVAFDHPESHLIWDKDITVNANLSGLRLLHVHDLHREVDLIQILGSVPVLESLIVGDGANLDVDFFRALVPDQTSGSRQPNGVTQVPTVVCPILESLQVEWVDPTEQSELVHVLRQLVMLRAVAGSPLKRLTFVDFDIYPKSRFELIGGDGSVTMEKTSLDDDEWPFELDI